MKRTHFDPTNGPMLFSNEEISDIIASEQTIPLFCNSSLATAKATPVANVTKQLNVFSLKNTVKRRRRKKSRFQLYDDYDSFFQQGGNSMAIVPTISTIATLLENDVCFQPTDAEYWAENLKAEYNIINRFDLQWTSSDELLQIGMPQPLIDKILLWQEFSDITNNF